MIWGVFGAFWWGLGGSVRALRWRFDITVEGVEVGSLGQSH